MWKDSVELKIIRLEGFPCSSTELACYLYYKDALHDQLIPINEEKSLMLSEEDVYRLEIANDNTQEAKTISFHMTLFKEDGVRWLPLFSQDQDYINEIPSDVSLPRVLVIFYKKRALSMVDEHNSNEDVEETEEIDEILNEEPLVSTVVSDEKLVQDYKIALEYERKLRDEQEKNIAKLSKELHESIKRSLIREDSLIQLITVKEDELLSAQSEISSLRSKIKKIELEKSQLTDVLESLKSEKECLNVEGLHKELEMFTHYFRDCEEITKIKAKLEAYENKDMASKEQENLISEVFKGRNVEIKRENEAVYSISTKRVVICVKEGFVFFRNLGGLQKFEDFFLSSPERSMTPSNKLHRRIGSDLKTIESESLITARKVKSKRKI